MSKHFFRKTLVMLLLVTVLVSSMAMPVSAADSKMTIKYIFYGTDYLTFPVTYYDGTSATARMAGMNIHYIDGKVAYCLEPQASSTANTIYSSFSNNDSTFWGKKISPAKQNAIMLAMAYGAPNKLSSSNAYTNYGYMAATQIVIWEILMDYRSATPPYACTNSRLYNHMIKSSGGNSDDVAGMKNGYAAINASLAAHGKIPSFAKVAQSQAETKEMQYDAASGKYTLTLTDSNNAINSDFTFSGSGVTCTKSGNKLTITAPASAVQGKTVLITGVGSNPDVSSIAPVVWGTQNSNGSRDQILCQYGSPDPVKVYFKVTASSTSLDIVKQADDGNVANITFTVKDNAGNTLFTGKTNSQGKLNVPGLTIGQTVTVTETVPANYVADQRTQTITLKAGTNTLTFVNHPMGTLAMKKTLQQLFQYLYVPERNTCVDYRLQGSVLVQGNMEHDIAIPSHVERSFFHIVSLLFYIPKRAQKNDPIVPTGSRIEKHPIGQALAPYLPAGCCAVLGLVPRALSIGFYSVIADIGFPR